MADPRGRPAFVRLLAALVSVTAIVGGALLAGGGAQPSGAERASKPTATTAPPPPTTQPPRVPDPSSPARIVTPNEDLPTPFVLLEQGWYFMYAYEGRFGRGGNLTVRVSPDFQHWGPSVDVLPQTPGWVIPTTLWAPNVAHIGNEYVLYFTGQLAGQPAKRQCIGTATASNPLGPFTPNEQILVCQLDRLGTIDPRTFVDADGSLWLHFKSDDNADTEGTTHTSIYAQRLSPDGLSLIGQPTIILNADQPWEGRIVEAGQMLRVNGRYWLFYSANWYNQPVYGIGIASCQGPAGPCTKPNNGPFLGSNAQGRGPGEQSLFTDGKGTWMVYAPWAVDFRALTVRPVALAHIGFDDSGPYLAAQ